MLQTELRQLKEQLVLEKEAWEENYRKKQETHLMQKVSFQPCQSVVATFKCCVSKVRGALDKKGVVDVSPFQKRGPSHFRSNTVRNVHNRRHDKSRASWVFRLWLHHRALRIFQEAL